MLVMGWDPFHYLHMGHSDLNTAPAYNLSSHTYCKGDLPSPCPAIYYGWNKAQPQITLSCLKEDKISPPDCCCNSGAVPPFCWSDPVLMQSAELGWHNGAVHL